MSVLSRLLTALVALALGGGSAYALAACGQDEAGRIAPGDAEAITQALDGARQAYAGGACDEAADQVEQARDAASGLPGSVDSELRARIRDGFRALDEQLVPDCEAEVSTDTLPETTSTATSPPETTETDTIPTTETATTPTEPEPPVEPVEPEPLPEDVPPVDPVPPTEIPPPDTGGVEPEGFE